MKALRAHLALVAPVLAALAVACAPAGEEDVDADEGAQSEQRPPDMRPELAQVNDVSILYPLPTNAGELEGLLPATTAALGGPLVPAAVYEKAFGAPGTLQTGGTPAAPPLAGLRLVAARFDPCFAAIGPVDDATCDNQLRLIFQPVKVDTGADDTAIHAFYSLSRAELRDAVEEVIAIRRSRSDERLGALAPHPLMKSEGLRGATARAIGAVIVKYAGASNLSRFTIFTTSGLGTAWNFTGFDIAASGDVSRMPIPNVPDGAPMVAFFAGFRPGELTGEPPFTPAATGARPEDNMQLLGNGAWAARSSVDAERRQVAFDATVRVENPALHSPDTVDCATCHAAEPARRIVGEGKLGLTLRDRSAAFVASAEFVPADERKLTSIDTGGINVHMFSYKGKAASIHPRTVNESADVVAYLNANVLTARRPR
ncbi:MAG: hypothetical protein KF894_05145 [Labilithrix sp.]|nr:hypothetical protein [Labilithrix sp.]